MKKQRPRKKNLFHPITESTSCPEKTKNFEDKYQGANYQNTNKNSEPT